MRASTEPGAVQTSTATASRPCSAAGPTPGWRTAALVEHHGPDLDKTDPDHPGKNSGNPTTYQALRTTTYTYVEYADGTKEYYNRASDPNELHNTAPTLPPAQHYTPTWPPSPSATAKPPAGAPATPLTRPAALGLAGTPPSTPRWVRSPSTTTAPGRSRHAGSAAPARSRPARRSGQDGCGGGGGEQLSAYVARELSTFDLPLAPAGTAFQQRVWAGDPYGQTRSYGELAAALGRPGAARAVGVANDRNPVSIIVPCHRVIGADGSMTVYGGGVERKRALLEHERGAGLR